MHLQETKTTIFFVCEHAVYRPHVGTAAVKLHDERVVGVNAQRIQVDEIWQFCYSNEKNVPQDKKGVFGFGDVWTWCAIDADSKMIVSYLVGPRAPRIALSLMEDLQSRITCRVPQITTDGLRSYKYAIDTVFGMDVDYAQLQKNYAGTPTEGARPASVRYSPQHHRQRDQGGNKRQPGPEAREHVLHRTPEPHHADEHAPVHALVEWLFQEDREPRSRRGLALRVLQLLPRSQNAACHASDGSGAHGSRVEHRRIADGSRVRDGARIAAR